MIRHTKNTPKESLKRIQLFMSYDQSLTLKENVNQLIEQTGEGLTTFETLSNQVNSQLEKQRKSKEEFDSQFITFPIPPNKFNVKDLIAPIGTQLQYVDKNDNLVNFFNFKNWLNNPTWSKYVPSDKDLKYIFPENKVIAFKLPDETLYKVQIRRISDNPLKWEFLWFYDNNGQPYDQQKILGDVKIPVDYLYDPDGFWEKWGQWIMAGLSVAALALIPPPAGLWISIGLDMIPAVEDAVKGNYLGATISTILAFLPAAFIKIPGVGTISQKEASTIAEKFANAADEQAIERIYRTELSDTQKKYFRTVFSQDPHKIFTELDKVFWNNISQGLQTGAYDAKELVKTINNLISEGKLKYPDLVKWYQKADVKRFGIDLGSVGLVMGAAYGYGKYQEDKKLEDIIVTRPKASSYNCEEKNKQRQKVGLPPKPCN